MSADNWAVCPKCKAAREEEIAKMREKVDADYGVVSIRVFDETRARLDALVETSKQQPQTMRENYEFYGVEEGVVCWSYSASCTSCNLIVRFTGAHPFWPPKET